MEASGEAAYGMQMKTAPTMGQETMDKEAVSNTAISYLFWTAGLFGFCGLHRLYNGKIASGLLWMTTFGLLGIGQFVDLAYIPDMAEARSKRLRNRQYQQHQFGQASMVQATQSQAAPLTLQLLKLAKQNNGRVTVTDAVLATEAPFSEVEHELKELVKSGYAHVSNDAVSGVVVYEIPELVA